VNNRSPKEIWEAALGELQIEVSKANYHTWFHKTVGLNYQDNQFTIGVPNTFVAEYLDKNQHSLVARVLTGILHDDVRLDFRVTENDSKLFTERNRLPLFNPRYTFDTFVVGNSNQLAYAAATKVAENPGQTFNPLFIHGGSGLGKTHLLHAIGNHAAAEDLKVLCVSAEQYTNELVTSIRNKTMDDFRDKFRSTDMLLVDDIQFFSGKEQTEENFFHTFNQLHYANRQVVVTCDRPPKELPMLKEALRSRFEWGLVADLQAPDYSTRLAVLKSKARAKGTEITPEALEFIALQIKDNMRSLEGSLNRVVAYAELLHSAVTPEMAARALDGVAGIKPELPPVSPTLIAETVAVAFQVTLSQLKGRQRDQQTVIARQVCMYLMRQETECSLSDIGRELGGRSPATISYAYEKIAGNINDDPHLRRQVYNIQQVLHTDRPSQPQ
jgi:chromosomal replication initiator protein